MDGKNLISGGSEGINNRYILEKQIGYQFTERTNKING